MTETVAEELRRTMQLPHNYLGGGDSDFSVRALRRNPPDVEVTFWRAGSSFGRSYTVPAEPGEEAPTLEAAIDRAAAQYRAEVREERDVAAKRVAVRQAKEERKRSRIEAAQRGETPEGDFVIGFKCPECGAVQEYDHLLEDPDPRYECGEDGEFSRSESDADNHQCPQCHKFGAKVAPDTCPECLNGVDGYDMVRCITVDNELVEVPDGEDTE